jgi:ribonuclease J
MAESKELIEQSCDLVARTLDHGASHPADWGYINNKVKEVLNKFFYEQTKRHPMILPFMVKV